MSREVSLYDAGHEDIGYGDSHAYEQRADEEARIAARAHDDAEEQHERAAEENGPCAPAPHEAWSDGG
jgi:hypothetical protein